jgi:hypothetical protein
MSGDGSLSFQEWLVVFRQYTYLNIRGSSLSLLRTVSVKKITMPRILKRLVSPGFMITYSSLYAYCATFALNHQVDWLKVHAFMLNGSTHLLRMARAVRQRAAPITSFIQVITELLLI